MSTSTIQWHTWADLQTQDTPLVICTFIHAWSPLALQMAHNLMQLQTTLPPYVSILMLDADKNLEAYHSFNINMTPATLFYYHKTPIPIRSFHIQDTHWIIGVISPELLSELVPYAKQAGENKTHLSIEI